MTGLPEPEPRPTDESADEPTDIGARYAEPARSYVTSLALLALLLAGFLIDLLVLGGGATHAVGWAIAALIVVGLDVLSVRLARARRSIVLTATELRVGPAAVERTAILAVEAAVDPTWPVLGRRPGEGLPRSARGLGLVLTGGAAVLVPTRHPGRLAAALDRSAAVTVVRPAEPDDLPQLAEIAHRAATLYRVAGLAVPELPFPLDALRAPLAVFVAGRPPVGLAQVYELDGTAHLQELAVLPGRMGRGIGTALLDAACGWAREQGYPSITMIAFAQVAWNAPFLQGRGFVPVTQFGPELAELRDWERDVGLDAVGPRTVLRRELSA